MICNLTTITHPRWSYAMVERESHMRTHSEQSIYCHVKIAPYSVFHTLKKSFHTVEGNSLGCATPFLEICT